IAAEQNREYASGGVSDWITTIACGAGAWVRCQRLRGTDISRIEEAIASAQHQFMVKSCRTISKAEARTKIILGGGGEVAAACCVIAGHYDGIRRGVKIGLPVEAFSWCGEDVVT